MEARVEADLRGEARRRDERAHLLHDVEPRGERLLAQQRLARGDDRVHEVAVRRGGRDDHDRLDVGIVDDGLRVGRDPFERADAARRLDRLGGEVGDRDGPHLAVFGEEAQRVRVALADHPRADESDTDGRVRRGDVGHASMLARRDGPHQNAGLRQKEAPTVSRSWSSVVSGRRARRVGDATDGTHDESTTIGPRRRPPDDVGGVVHVLRDHRDSRRRAGVRSGTGAVASRGRGSARRTSRTRPPQ